MNTIASKEFLDYWLMMIQWDVQFLFEFMNSQDSTINFAPYAQNIFMVIVNIILILNLSYQYTDLWCWNFKHMQNIMINTHIWFLLHSMDKMIDQVRKYDRFNTT